MLRRILMGELCVYPKVFGYFKRPRSNRKTQFAKHQKANFDGEDAVEPTNRLEDKKLIYF